MFHALYKRPGEKILAEGSLTTNGLKTIQSTRILVNFPVISVVKLNNPVSWSMRNSKWRNVFVQ